MHKRFVTFLALAGLLIPVFAHAAAMTSVGPRVGFSLDPDQFTFGGQAVIGDVAPDITFDPSVELGFGDNFTIIALNLDGKYHFAVENTPWSPHVGFGLGINFIDFDVPPSAQPFVDSSTTEVGANVIVGAGVPLSSGNSFFTELRLGIGDIPDLKIMAGWNFAL